MTDDPQAERPVAYRSPGTRTLYCVICARQESGWQPIAAANVRGDAKCDFCGGRVLAVAVQRLGAVVARYAAAAVPSAPADRADELAKHVTRAIFALKSPAPAGSEHYRSGWDDGLEAAIDAARDTVLRRLADEAQQPETPTNWTPGPVAVARAAEWASQQRAATVDPAMCPRCKGDNSEAFELCTRCADEPPAAVSQPGKEG